MIGGQRPTSGDPRGCTAPGVRGSAMFVVMEVVVVVVVVEVAVVAGVVVLGKVLMAMVAAGGKEM